MKVFIGLFFLLMLSSCETVSDRSISSSLKEGGIERDINNNFYQIHHALANNVIPKVQKDVAVLMGHTSSEELRQKAEKAALKVRGVKKVENHIEIIDFNTIWDDTEDSSITSKVKSVIFFDADVKTSNYKIITSNRKVFIFGVARNESELKKVANHARQVPGVIKVYCFVEILSNNNY